MKKKQKALLILCFNDAYNMLKEAANRKIIVEVKILMFINKEESKKETVEAKQSALKEETKFETKKN